MSLRSCPGGRAERHLQSRVRAVRDAGGRAALYGAERGEHRAPAPRRGAAAGQRDARGDPARSEEHTSELQSQSNLVCRLLLEKKKKEQIISAKGNASTRTSCVQWAAWPTPGS